MTQQEATGNPNNATKMRVLLSLMDEKIAQYNLIGIAMWSDKAYECMLHIEVDNGLYSME